MSEERSWKRIRRTSKSKEGRRRSQRPSRALSVKWKWKMKRRNRDVYTSVIYPQFLIPHPRSLISLQHITRFVTLTLVWASPQFPPWSPATRTPPWRGKARPRSWTARHEASSPSSSAGRGETPSSTPRGIPAIPSPSIRKAMKSSPPLRLTTDSNRHHRAVTPKFDAAKWI